MSEHIQTVVPVRLPANSDLGRYPDASNLLEDLLVKCIRCRALLYSRDVQRNLKVCPDCGYHFRLSAAERIASLLDTGSFVEAETHMRSGDPLRFRSQSYTYPQKLAEEQRRTGLNEAVVI